MPKVDFGNCKSILWEKYINYVDPCSKLNVETRELMRGSFCSDATFCLDMLYKQEEDKE